MRERTQSVILAITNGSHARIDSLGYTPLAFFRDTLILKQGRDHKWWLSARLLLGLSEQEADMIKSIEFPKEITQFLPAITA